METNRSVSEQIVTIHPATEQEWLDLRMDDITSTDVAALFGISPYLTDFELWHRKKNRTFVDFKETERIKWGQKLQDTIAAGIAEEQGWEIRRMDEYIRNPALRIGASFDHSIERGPMIRVEFPETIKPYPGQIIQTSILKGILEVKNVDSLQFKQGWIENEDKSIEAPPHIEIQVQHQLMVSGRAFSFLAAFVGGNRVVLLRREPDQGVIDAIKKRVAEFWISIDKGEEPKPDYSRDSKMIAKLYGYAEPGKVVEVTPNTQQLAEEYLGITKSIKALEVSKAEMKARILEAMGSAEKMYSIEFTISAGMIGPVHVEYDRKGYRDFRVIPKRGRSK